MENEERERKIERKEQVNGRIIERRRKVCYLVDQFFTHHIGECYRRRCS